MFIVSLEYLEDGQVFAEHAKLPIHGYGENLRDALDAFCEAFDYQWQSLVEVPEETLTSGGKRRRADLMSSVKKVVEVES